MTSRAARPRAGSRSGAFAASAPVQPLVDLGRGLRWPSLRVASLGLGGHLGPRPKT